MFRIVLGLLILKAAILGRSAIAQESGIERLPEAYVVLFTPADVEPPTNAQAQLGLAARYAEQFFAAELKRWKYPPGREAFFAREADGTVRVLHVKGTETLAKGKYEQAGFHDAAILNAMKQYKIPAHKNVWWVWAYLGPSVRFREYKGNGSPQRGGWSVCDLDPSLPPLELKRPMAWDTNETFTLKGCLHEFGHALGLPHAGPHRKDDAGNELMGPRTVRFHREHPREDRVYLSEATAAMLWKHPVISGTTRDRGKTPQVELKSPKAVFRGDRNSWVVTGTLVSDMPAHTAVVLDETEAHTKEGGRDRKAYAARIKPDGSFSVVCDEPTGTDGRLRILFCFDNGMTAGKGVVSDLNLDVAFDFPYVASGRTYRLKP